MNLKSISLAVALFSCVVMHGVELPPLSPVEGTDVMGYVHDGTKGVPGVLVSDGYDFARTDDNGAYHLASNPDALMVYVILPSGYEFADVSGGVVKFFKEIDRTASDFQADFAIRPIGDDTSFSFLLHADTQPKEYFNPQVFPELGNAYKDMKKCADELAAADGFTPFNLHMGDIVYNNDNDVEGYGRYLTYVRNSGYDIPILPTPGNHDRFYVTDYNKSLSLYRETWGPERYSFNRGKVHFISLDNVHIEKEGDFAGAVRPEAVEWLKKDLSFVEKGSRVVLFGHRAFTRNKTTCKNFASTLELLKDYDVLILSGHLHQSFNNFPSYAPSIKERNHIALGGNTWRGPCTRDGVPRGYYIYMVNGTDISWKYKQTGKNPDTNMFRLYEPGLFNTPVFAPSDDKTVIVNVWDWDEDWKVTWSLDGVEQGDVSRYDSARDPWAVYNYDNDTETGSAETYHIFHCDVPSTGSVVKVTVADPFGCTLSKELTLEAAPSGGIETVAPESCGVLTTEIYNMQGIRVLSVGGYPETDTLPLSPGCYIMHLRHTDGTLTTEKTVL